jgi:hypothetical protein
VPTVTPHTTGASAGDRSRRVESATRPRLVRLSAQDIWAFILPAVSFAQVAVIGQLFLSELLMLVMLPWLWSAKDRAPLPRWFVALWAGWFFSQIVTDVVMGSALEDLARGWAAIAFTFTDFAAVLVLAATPTRARLFALGLATGGILGYFIAPATYAAADPWKFAFGLPVGFLLAASVAGSIGKRVPLLPIATFAAFGALNLLLGYRNLGGIALLASAYLLLNTLVGRRQSVARPSLARATAGALFCVIAAFSILQGYDLVASQGLLGASARATYLQESGSLGVLVGGRPEFLTTTQAIIDSPILGHGSWAKDFKYVDLLATRLSSLGYNVEFGPSDVGLIPAHSFLLGSWVWAGFLGGLFWIGILVLAGWLWLNLFATRGDLAPLLIFSTALLLWNIVFSPYGGGARLLTTYGIALCLLALRLMKGDARVRHESGTPAGSPLRTSVDRRTFFPATPGPIEPARGNPR